MIIYGIKKPTIFYNLLKMIYFKYGKNLIINLKKNKELLKISKALANQWRIDILRLLSVESLSVYEISKKI